MYGNFNLTQIAPVQWFTKAGFTDVKIKRIGPKWYRGVRRHGLIMGCSVTGIKAKVNMGFLHLVGDLFYADTAHSVLTNCRDVDLVIKSLTNEDLQESCVPVEIW